LADRDDPEDGDLHPETVAAYIAKYATKATAVEPGAGVQAHLRQIRRTVERLGRAATREPRNGVDAEVLAPYGRLGRWEDALGFRGRFGTASRIDAPLLAVRHVGLDCAPRLRIHPGRRGFVVLYKTIWLSR